MRTYTFYLYDDEGALLGSSSQTLDSDELAQAHAREIFRAYPGCEEVEVWEAPRYIAQGRRTRDDLLAPEPQRELSPHTGERARLRH